MKSKITSAKKVLRKNIKVNTKVTFDDDGEVGMHSKGQGAYKDILKINNTRACDDEGPYTVFSSDI